MDQSLQERLVGYATASEAGRSTLAEWDSLRTDKLIEGAIASEALAAALWEILWRGTSELNEILGAEPTGRWFPNPFLARHDKDDNPLQWPSRVAEVDREAAALLAAALRVETASDWRDEQAVTRRLIEDIVHRTDRSSSRWQEGRWASDFDAREEGPEANEEILTRLILLGDVRITNELLRALATSTRMVLENSDVAGHYGVVADHLIWPATRAITRVKVTGRVSVAMTAGRSANELRRSTRSDEARTALREASSRWWLVSVKSVIARRRRSPAALRGKIR